MSLPERELFVEENLHYVKPLTGLCGQTFANYVLAGDGLTDWTQSTNLETDDGQYIHESVKHSNIKAYGDSVAYSGNAYPSDPFNYWLYLVGKQQVKDATFEEIEVETWNETSTTGTYVAYKRTYNVQPSNPGSGAGGEKLAVEGTFGQLGSVVVGTYNMSSSTFTAD